MIITIDGPAGSGKTTISKYFSQHYTYNNTPIYFLSSGAFYRICTWCILQSLPSHPSNEMLLQETKAHYKDIVPKISWENGEIHSNFFLKNKKVMQKELYNEKLSLYTSKVSCYVPLRKLITKRMQDIISNGNWIIEGRDAGSHIVPNANIKIYLDASEKTRISRRIQENDQTKANPSLIAKKIKERDKIDKNKGEYSLIKKKDAIYIKTDHLSIENICKKIYTYIRSTSML